MILSTRGIVLSTTNYAENSVVARIYTEQLGIQAYLINGVRKSKASIKSAMLQPLTLLDMEVYSKPNRDLQRIKEIKPSPVLYSAYTDMAKCSICFFLAEMLQKVLKEEEPQQELFQFIHQSIQLLDAIESSVAAFHIQFLIQLTRYLGFSPHGEFSTLNFVFDLQEGRFQSHFPVHPHFMAKEDAQYFSHAAAAVFDSSAVSQIPSSARRQLLYNIVQYYQLHIEGFSSPKSLGVLADVMN